MRVWTNGCFDLLHYGHVHFLKRCAAMGDLTVWLNTDVSIHSLKGEGRPIVSQAHRELMIEALIPNVRVRSFGYHSPVIIWERFPQSELPQMYIKEVGCEQSDEVKFLQSRGIMCAFVPRIAGISTTEIVAKCRAVEPPNAA